VLLADSAGDGGAAGQTVFARGGPGRVARALVAAAQSFGAELRTGAEVAAVRSGEGRVSGVTLASGQEIDARTVVAGIDPKRLLTRLVDPLDLGPGLLWRAGNLRLHGMVAKVNLALAELPVFGGIDAEDGARLLRGRIVIAPGIDALERAFDAAKYGRLSEEPYLEATIPTLVDPSLIDDGVTATRHVMSVIVQYAPYHLRDGCWDDGGRREALYSSVLTQLERYAPGIGRLVTARQVLTPLDLERDHGLTEGHPLHGEPGLDQFFAWRPLLGHARYRMPLAGLYLCGAGAHPGGGVTATPGRNAAREVIADLRRPLRA
jgi:phytoene dehydrogenase-like protein